MTKYEQTVSLTPAIKVVVPILAATTRPIPFLSKEGYIPYKIIGAEFELRVPIIERIGSNAIHLSLGEPFGVKESLDVDNSHLLVTQKTNGLIIQQGGDVTFVTEEPLTNSDQTVFADLLEFYTSQVLKDYCGG